MYKRLTKTTKKVGDGMVDFIATPFVLADIEILKRAGADSVVIAVPFFSARGAAVFPLEQLSAVKEECVRCGVRMLVLVNRIFVEEELDDLRAFLKVLKQLDVDGIYYGDEGVLYEAEKLEMKQKLIYNPDTLITNAMDMQFYLDEGIQMATISKEITLAEMCEIASRVQGECEVIVHGRLNMMHSKRRLLSSYMDFLGKKECVVENRQLYLMEETRDEHMPIIEDALGTHVFTGFTLVSFMEMQELYAAGIRHFRIDGIFHDIAYVCEALQLYRKVLSNELDGRKVYEEYQKKYEQDHVTHGFYYTKTSKVK